MGTECSSVVEAISAASGAYAPLVRLPIRCARAARVWKYLALA